MSGTFSQSTSSFFQRRSGRRGFLRGAAIGAAGTAAVAVAGVAPLLTSGGSASAAPGTPPLSVTTWGARHNLAILSERVAGATSLVGDRWRATGQVQVKNNAVTTVNIYRIRVSYIGDNAPSHTTLEFEFDPIYLSPGASQWIDIPDARLHSYPMPAIMQVRLWANGYDSPRLHEVYLYEYDNEIPGGAYYFPGKNSDLPAGQYWATGNNHGYGSNHGGSLSQRFAYDLHARRWAGTKWSRYKPDTDGSQNSDDLIWGTPIYAPATGYIIAGFRERADGAPGEQASPGGGNGFWIQTEAGTAETGGFWLLAHMMQFSPPEELVPNGEGGPGPLVYRGQFLGLVGNSGKSSGPHLHIHFQRGMSDYLADAKSTYGEGRPLKFRSLRVRQFYANGTHWEPNPWAPWHWNFVSPYAGIGEYTLIDPDGPPLVVPTGPRHEGPSDKLAVPRRSDDTLGAGSSAGGGGLTTG